MKCTLPWPEKGRMWKYCPYTSLIFEIYGMNTWKRVASANFICVKVKYVAQARHIDFQHFSQGRFSQGLWQPPNLQQVLRITHMFQVQSFCASLSWLLLYVGRKANFHYLASSSMMQATEITKLLIYHHLCDWKISFSSFCHFSINSRDC